MAIYKFSVSTGYVGSEKENYVEIPDEELEGKTEDEKYEYIYENYFRDWLEENIDYVWERKD